jgi:hypothetical protein
VSAFVFLVELPRTPTGKVDRRQLPEPPTEASRAGGDPTVVRNLELALWSGGQPDTIMDGLMVHAEKVNVHGLV